MKFLFANNASSVLAAGVAPLDTLIPLAIGTGQLFPNPGANEGFYVTIVNASGTHEIVLCTARDIDTLVVTRGQQGTPQQSWNAGDRIELRVTAANLDAFLQAEGEGTDSGGAVAFETVVAGNVITPKITGVANRPESDLYLRSGNVPLVFGSRILVDRHLLQNMIFMFHGSVASIPPEFQLCDGTNGTPNLKDKFIVGAGNTYAPGDQLGGGTNRATTESGAHGHTVGNTALSINQMPKHGHLTRYSTASGRTSEGQGSLMLVAAGTIQNKFEGYITSSTAGEAIAAEGGGATHSHSLTGASGHTHSVDIRPPYYALCYIKLKPTAISASL